MAENVGAVALDIVVGKNEVDGYLGKLGGVAKGVGTAVGAGLAVASGAILSIGKQAVASYGEYEQLVGGVETLFKDNADAVIENADRAFKTAGLSANDYMSTVTSFSASLLQSVGGDTAKASEMADMAITDMADNANKMGTSMEMIQNAYNGFAKQNYTMLDNLKLGYGGTKTEMERLLADAEKFSGIKYDISSYADVVDAIHVIQGEMGISGRTAEEAQAIIERTGRSANEVYEQLGTTAKEASQTIQGSITSTKSAWNNLITGLADDTADIPTLVANVVASGTNVVKNLVPVIKQTLKAIPNAISAISPEAGEAFQAIVNFAEKAFPVIKDVAITAFKAISTAITFISENQGLLIGVGVAIGTIVTAIGLYNAVSAVKQAMAVAEVTTVWGLVSAYIAQASAMAATLAPYVAIVAGIGAVIAIIVLCIKYWDDIVNAVKIAVDAIGNFFVSLWNGVVSAWNWCVELLSGVGTWIYDNVIAPVANFFTELWNGIVNTYHVVIGPWVEIIRRASVIVYNEIIKPILDYFVGLWNNIKSVFSVVGNWFKITVVQPLSNVFTSAWNGLKNGAINAWNGVKSVFSSVADFFGNIFSNAWAKVKAVFSVGGKIFDGIKDGIVSGFKTVVNAIIRGINKVITVPFNGINAVLNKLRDISILGVSPFAWISTISVPQIPQLEQGGVLKKGQVGLLEGKGAEAVVPLERNLGWLNKVATLLSDRLDISRAFDLPMLHNVRAGNNNPETESKFDRIIALLEMLLEKEDGDITIPVQIGNELIDEYITNKNSRQILRSGGRA